MVFYRICQKGPSTRYRQLQLHANQPWISRMERDSGTRPALTAKW